MRRDFDVETLVGSGGLGKILRPVDLAAVTAPVATIADAVRALRLCVNACTLLANQAGQIRNSILLRLSLLQHLFLQVLPIPLPIDSPEAAKGLCFWGGAPWRHETQVEVLQDLRLLARHFATASLSVKNAREADAGRLCCLGSMLCIADAVLRATASDFPSPVSLHYSGAVAGPVAGFALDIGEFAIESETLLMTDPYLATARAQILEYMHRCKAAVPSDHIIMSFHSSSVASAGDALFIDQICVHLGFERYGSPSEQAATYISGADSEIVDHFPELAAFRDVCFFFSLFMVPSLDLLPPLKRWRMRDSALSWGTKSVVRGTQMLGRGGGSEGKYLVSSFGGFELKPHKRPPAKKGVLEGFMGLFTGGPQPRAPPSGADPSLVVGQDVRKEDDVLHLATLPSFSELLPPSDAERLIQMLTVPYLRIPLVLAFFADEARLNALADKDLQNIVDSCLFEPGAWQAQAPTNPPDLIPDISRATLATPCGLLVNELVHAPVELMQHVRRILDLAMDMDSGSYQGPSTAVILYVVRLATRVCHYAGFVLRNFELRRQAQGGVGGGGAKASGTGYQSLVRGLCPQASRAAVMEELNTLTNALQHKMLSKAWPMLESW